MMTSMGTTNFEEPRELADGTVVVYVTGSTWSGSTRAVGMFTVRDGRAEWTAATDDSRLKLLGIGTGLVATVLSLIAVNRRPPWPDLSSKTMAAIHADETRQVTRQP